jgi:uncharacterized protein YjbI with pentapeptide repeats
MTGVSKEPLAPAEPDLDEEERPEFDGSLARLVDAVVRDADLANARAPGALLRRVRLERVRLTGVELPESTIEDVVFADCRLDLASLRLARLARVRFERCRMEELDLQGATLSSVFFVECALQRATWAGVKLTRTELRGCDLAGAINPERLRGMRMPWPDAVNAVAELASAAGVEIVE